MDGRYGSRRPVRTRARPLVAQFGTWDNGTQVAHSCQHVVPYAPGMLGKGSYEECPMWAPSRDLLDWNATDTILRSAKLP